MKLYRLRIRPGEAESEATPLDEHYGSLGEARHRRTELIRSTPESDYRHGEDFEIERLTLEALPPGKLALALLNRRGIAKVEEVVGPYQPGRAVQHEEVG